MSFAFIGCGEDRPNDKITSEKIREIAEADVHDGLELVDFRRDNGWVDEKLPNRYKVQYAYNLRLIKPYAETILGNAQVFQRELASEKQKAGTGFFDANAMENRLTALQLNVATTKWIQDQSGEFPKRRDFFLATCPNCIAYWNSEDNPSEAAARRLAFIATWILFESYGFKDDAKIGDTVSRVAWAMFTKSEKGWQPVQ